MRIRSVLEGLDALGRMPSVFDQLVASMHSIPELVRRIHSARPPPPTSPTYVYVLPPLQPPPDAVLEWTSAPILGAVAVVEAGHCCEVPIEVVVAMAAGAWVTAVGPARISSVRIGPQVHSRFATAHCCRIEQACSMGHRITVDLRG